VQLIGAIGGCSSRGDVSECQRGARFSSADNLPSGRGEGALKAL
jgi:hypothetical protein